jgi:hypothetical protein
MQRARTFGCGEDDCLGHSDGQARLVPKRADPHHFAHARISTVAAGDYHSAAVSPGGALYTWGRGEADYQRFQVLDGQANTAEGAAGQSSAAGESALSRGVRMRVQET